MAARDGERRDEPDVFGEIKRALAEDADGPLDELARMVTAPWSVELRLTSDETRRVEVQAEATGMPPRDWCSMVVRLALVADEEDPFSSGP